MSSCNKQNIKLNVNVNTNYEPCSDYIIDYYNYQQNYKDYINNLTPCSQPQINPEYIKYQNAIQREAFFNKDRVSISLTGNRTVNKLYQPPICNTNNCNNVISTNIIYDNLYIPPTCENTKKKCDCSRCHNRNPQELILDQCNVKKYY